MLKQLKVKLSTKKVKFHSDINGVCANEYGLNEQ